MIRDIEIPSSVRDLVQARVADLEPEDRDLLDVAAVLRLRVRPGARRRGAGHGRDPALRRLRPDREAHRLVRSAGRRFVFDHHQVQEALYQGLLALLREEYHAAIGDALEKRIGGGAGGAEAVALCEHFLKSASPLRARPYLGKALSQLERDYGADAPGNVARLALAAPGLLAGRDRAEMLLRFARNLDLSGKREEERSALDEALSIAKGLSDAALGARAIGLLGGLLLQTARFDEARRRFDEALDLARKAGRPGRARRASAAASA